MSRNYFKSLALPVWMKHAPLNWLSLSSIDYCMGWLSSWNSFKSFWIWHMWQRWFFKEHIKLPFWLWLMKLRSVMRIVITKILPNIAFMHELFQYRSMNWNLACIYQLLRPLRLVNSTCNNPRLVVLLFFSLFLLDLLKRFLEFCVVINVKSHVLWCNQILTWILIFKLRSDTRNTLLGISYRRWVLVWIGMDKVQKW